MEFEPGTPNKLIRIRSHSTWKIRDKPEGHHVVQIVCLRSGIYKDGRCKTTKHCGT